VKFSTVIKLVLGLLIAALGLYIFFKDVDVDRLIRELGAVNVNAIIVCCGLAVFVLYLRAVRWYLFLPSTPGTSKKYLFKNVTIGFMVNNILPARIGEAVRALILWQKNGYPVTVCIGSVVLERIIDLMMFLLVFIIPVLILPQCSFLMPYAIVAGCLVLLGILAMLFYANFQTATGQIGSWMVSKLPERFRDRLTRIGKELSSTLGWLNSPGLVLGVISLSFIICLCYVVMVILITGKTDISFGILEGMFIQAFAAFGSAIPLAPGYVGTQHAVVLQGLEILGMDGDKARALAIIYHALNYVVINILGLVFFFSMKLSFKEVFSAKKKLEE
jgi:uncharacterized protein (TIRG00374 family)